MSDLIEVTGVPFRCGALASITYPVDHPEVLVRFRRDLARRDCPACQQGLPPGVRAAAHVLHPSPRESPDGECTEDVADVRYWWIGREVERR